MTDLSRPLLFALGASRDLGVQVAHALGTELADIEERSFEDGEHKIRPLVSVRGRHAYVLHSLYSDQEQSVNDKLCRLLFFIGCLRDASAVTVNVLIPYLAYARKDRKTQPRDPVTTRYVALLLEAVGADRVVTLDVHNLAAFQNAFRCRTDHLEAAGLLVRHFAAAFSSADEPSVISPDAGGMKRAQRFRELLGTELGRSPSLGFLEKSREGGKMSHGQLVGMVEGRPALILDDLISTGGTLVGAARACKKAGATRAYAAATHGVFATEANDVLADEALDGIVITNSIPELKLSSPAVLEKLTVLDISPLLGEAIRRIHGGGSLVELLRPPFN